VECPRHIIELRGNDTLNGQLGNISGYCGLAKANTGDNYSF